MECHLALSRNRPEYRRLELYLSVMGRGVTRRSGVRIYPVAFNDIGDGVLADAEVAGDPTVVPPAVDSMEHLWSQPV